MIVFDASTLIGAALKPDSIPERALLRAEEVDVFALSAAIDAEIEQILGRPKFAHAIPTAARRRFLRVLRNSAVWFEPAVRITDCRDAKDNKYLELALAAGCRNDCQQRSRSSGIGPLARSPYFAARGISCRALNRVHPRATVPAIRRLLRHPHLLLRRQAPLPGPWARDRGAPAVTRRPRAFSRHRG
jgi:putative PIN family toxin of toxin-antitoxin system